MNLCANLKLALARFFEPAADGPFGNHATLTDDLVSYWSLDEVSGVRYDSVVASANDLTDNNTVGSAAGKNNLAASFVAANNESLTRTSVTAPASLSIAFWLNAPSMVADKDILGLFTTWPTAGAFHFRASPTIMTFLVATGAGFAQAGSGGGVTVNDGNWHLFIGTFSAADNTGRIYFDGDNLGTSNAALGAPISSSAHTFFIGNGVLGTATELVDEVGLWSRVLTAQERTDLYNGGAGLFYGS